ncbi:GNAT family N-acetyltransferase [Marinomonas flavescens]|uniref:GNAT family N-acetyltransferase n=1 Tax=Marinomonas flavescens TaxID=2529379 RepID=UPI001404FB0F|nr:GNAT family N-acetyltransferase [Marinomonas flavescens]
MKGNRFKWQFAEFDEASDISDLLNLAYRGLDNWTEETTLLDGKRASPSLVERSMKESGTYFFVCRNDTALLACIRLTLVGNEAYIGSFAVLPTYQRSGIGTHLLAEIEQIATKEYGVTFFSLPVLTGQNTLKKFYEKCGYHKTGNTEPYPVHLNIGKPKRSDVTIEFYLKKV